jgi:VWFA-related protein
MRRWAVLFILAGLALPALATKRVTVAQLEQELAADHGRSDDEVARRLSDLELSERLSAARFVSMESSLSGERAQQAFMMLADQSAFLDSPASEIPAASAPDLATQREILALTVNYVTQTVPQLPNFFATRITRSFEDKPAVQRPGVISSKGMVSSTAYQPLHRVGSLNETVFYRDGHEVVETIDDMGKKQLPVARRLTTSGVFGPILATVLVDAARSKLTWSHWEQGQTGLEAVFSYKVPKEKSHYTLSYDSVPTDPPNGCTARTQTFSQLVAYHGEITINPQNGTILRLVLAADMKPGDFTVKSGIVVEYGQVEIGGRIYFVPVKSVSSTLAHSLELIGEDCPGLQVNQTLKISLNDVVFDQYHVFRADATVLSENEAQKLERQPSPSPHEGSTKQIEKTTTSATAPTEPLPSAGAVTTESASAAPAVQTAVAANPIADTTPAVATSPTPQTGETEADQESLLSKMPVYKTNARDVIFDVVVTKGNGDPVLGLTKADFEVKEDGKLQTIDFLEEHTARTLPSEALQPMPKMPLNTYTNTPPAPEGDSVNVLLLDTLNTSQQDQAYVHSEITDFLKKMQPGIRVAIFALGSKLRYVQGFTTDTSVLLAALNDKRNGAAAVKQAGSRDRGDQSDDAEDSARLKMMRSQGVGALEAAQGDMAGFDFGARASMTFEALDHLANYLAGVPGRKNLIWFSSSFPVVIFPTAAQRKSIENAPNMRGYLDQVKKTADMLTVSQISVYPVGAEGMMTERIGEADNAGPAATEGIGHLGSVDDSLMGNGTTTPFVLGAGGRANAIASMEQLASSTGGKAYFNTNDLNVALERAINDGAHYYTLSYSPANTKLDGTYRDIEVHLHRGHYTLSYRRGYNADVPASLQVEPRIDPLLQALRLGMPGATGLLYGVRLVPAASQPAPDATRAGQNSKLKSPFTRYEVDFFLRWTDIAFQANAQGEHKGRIEVGLKAYDRDGNAVNWEGVTQDMNLQPTIFGAMQKSGVPAHMEIDLPNEDFYLVTGVYDWGTGNTGTLEIPLHPAVVTANAARPEPAKTK